MDQYKERQTEDQPVLEKILKEILVTFLVKRQEILDNCLKYLNRTFSKTIYIALITFALTVVIMGARGELGVTSLFNLLFINIVLTVVALTTYRLYEGYLEGVKYLHQKTSDLSIHGRQNFFEVNFHREKSDHYRSIDEFLGYTLTWEQQLDDYLTTNQYKPKTFSLFSWLVKMTEKMLWMNLVEYLKNITYKYTQSSYNSDEQKEMINRYNLTKSDDPGAVFVEITEKLTRPGRNWARIAYVFFMFVIFATVLSIG